VGEAVYAIDDFPDDDLFWRIEWIGGVGYNSSVPTDPLIDICLAQLRGGENNPLSARSRSSQIKRTVRIGVGLLPYIAIASVWRRRRPVFTNLAASRDRLCLDTSSCRIVPLADLANAIPRSSYLFGVSWPAVRRTLVATVEQNGDPYAVMIPTAEIIRMRARRRFPSSRAIMASNPVLSTTTKRRFRQRIVLPGVKATDTAITLLEYARSKRTKRFLVGFRIPQP
jgi:hypothetical protein